MRFPGKSAPAATASAGSSTHGNGSKFSFGVLATMLVCAAAFLGIGAPAASAAPEAEEPAWGFKTSFSSGGIFEQDPARNGISTDSAGNIFVAEQLFSVVRIFAPDPSAGGVLLTEFNPPVSSRNIAVDSSDDTAYVDEPPSFGGTSIHRWVSDGNPTPTYTLDPNFDVPLADGFAVDPTTHDLLVADSAAEAVHRYEADGTLADTMSTPGINPAFVAVAADGSFFIAPAGGGSITHLSGAGAVLNTIADVGAVDSMAWDPTDGVLVVSSGSALKTYSPAGQLLSQSGGRTSEGRGLAFDPVNELLYQADSSSVYVYAPAAIPGVETPTVSEVEPTSAHLNAGVDPGAGPPAESAARFEYSPDGGINWKETPAQELTSPGPTEIEADLTELEPNREYLVRVKASNAQTTKTSSSASFTTSLSAPDVVTGAVGDLSGSSATLYGTVNPLGTQTTYHFEYGTTDAYGNRVPLASEAPAGNLRVPRSVSKAITGLQSGTTYHYRLVAENAAGSTAGEDKTFTTLGSGDFFPARAFERVTPQDKGDAVVQSDNHVQVAPDGSAIAVTTRVADSDQAQSALIVQNYLSRRGASDWLDWQATDPPQDVVAGLNESATAAISEDFEHALVVSNRVLAPGGVAGGGNLYVKDMGTGQYTFVAGTSQPTPMGPAWQRLTGINLNETIFVAAAPDFSWIIFWGEPLFSPDASAGAIYRWSESGGLEIESVLPGGIAPPFPAQAPDYFQSSFPVTSTDGSILAYGLGAVWRRVDGGEPTAVSVSKIPGDSQEPQPGTLFGMTPDGRYIFFASSQRLTEDAPAVSDSSIYRYDASSNQLTYIGEGEGANIRYSVLGFSGDGQTAYFINAGGTFLWRNHEVRMIRSRHDPLAEVSGDTTNNGRYFGWADVGRNPEAYLYDAETDKTVCVSCPPSGALTGDARTVYSGRSIGNRASQVITESGEMFFSTSANLLAADHNSTSDVYGYKDGHLELISPGDEAFDAIFVAASEDGSSVFFQTTQGLVRQDTDGDADVYVARVGGGFASQNPPPPPGSCQGAECVEAGGQPAGGPPVNTAAANPVTAHKKHKHKTKKHRKHKKHKHKGKGHKSQRHHSRTLGN